MSHTHEHDHHHEHNHDHNNNAQSNLSFDEKIVKLLEHWIKHNDDHAGTYRDWSKKAKDNNLEQAGLMIQEAAEMTVQINDKFREALKNMNT
ncbi:MAG: hypothetical protein J7K84_03840 [Deltaproteobacteria bacterium]|nr:hypothetical protein [Deltaproteobacteria bacterium]